MGLGIFACYIALLKYAAIHVDNVQFHTPPRILYQDFFVNCRRTTLLNTFQTFIFDVTNKVLKWFQLIENSL